MSGYRASLSIRDRYQLRLLLERSRFYANDGNLTGLARRGLVAPTGSTDKAGRIEWTITDIGRTTFAIVEP